jgi:hypothetical protein
MCQGVGIFANNKKAVFTYGTNSHSTTAEKLHLNEDNWRHYEYLWWNKKIQEVHMDRVAEEILKGIDKKTARKHVNKLVKDNFSTQKGLVKWLKTVPEEWDELMKPKHARLAKRVNPVLVEHRDRIEWFKKQPIERFNPYQATKLPKLEAIRKVMPKAVRAQVWDQVGAQVRAQVWDQVGAQVRDQVGDQVRDQVGDQVRAQEYSTSYWAIKLTLGLPIKHWFFDFLKLGIMIVFVKGKIKVFGKKGKYLGEYDSKDL